MRALLGLFRTVRSRPRRSQYGCTPRRTWLMILPEHRIKWRSELPAHCATPRRISDLLEVGKSDASANLTESQLPKSELVADPPRFPYSVTHCRSFSALVSASCKIYATDLPTMLPRQSCGLDWGRAGGGERGSTANATWRAPPQRCRLLKAARSLCTVQHPFASWF